MSKKLIALLCTIGLLSIGGFGWMYGRAAGGESSESSAAGVLLQMDIRAEENGAVVMEENRFRITLNDKRGLPVERASIKVHLVMPGMFCGRVPAETHEVSPGLYDLLAIPVMAGKWEAEIVVVANGETLRATHSFNAV
ncbi:FixH family protein [Cohnella hongkongensis]|uniref:FixH family protein n=1 Tax=Cohnella hongkongensis TaxID=178337 RepID=A0ABV9FHX8_9BACL